MISVSESGLPGNGLGGKFTLPGKVEGCVGGNGEDVEIRNDLMWRVYGY